MKINTAFATLLAFACGAAAFKVRVWTTEDCEGEEAGVVHVWDNTCMDKSLDIEDIRSVQLIGKGGKFQRGRAYHNKGCFLGFEEDSWWADGGGFPMRKCKTFERGVNAFSSYAF